MDEWLDQWAGGWKALMNEQRSTSSAHFSKHEEVKACFLWGADPTGITAGEGHPAPSQPHQTWSLRLGQWEKGQLVPQASVQQPRCGQSQGPITVPPGFHSSISDCSALLSPCPAPRPDSLGNVVSCCELSPWAPRDPEWPLSPLSRVARGKQWGLPCRQPPPLDSRE